MMTRSLKRVLAAVAFCAVQAALTPFGAAKPVPGGMGIKAAPKPKPMVTGFTNGPDETLSFQVDPRSKRNQVVFVSTAPKETITGKTRTVSGKLTLNLRKLAESSGSFEVAWADLDTGDKTRNEHMLSPPWVDASAHPKISFSLSAIVPGEEQPKNGKTIKADLVGKMAMNGREKEMRIPATLAYLPESTSDTGVKKRERFAIRAKFTTELADYGIEGMGIGLKVSPSQQIKVSLVLTRAKKVEDDASAGGKPAGKGKKGKKKTDSKT